MKVLFETSLLNFGSRVYLRFVCTSRRSEHCSNSYS